ncbi:MAG TPA: IS1182 family transposase [Candidatus Sulfotelmatobacter sp.]|nr:IS1182 family transposase [Candidatus Sulfotelmatobacter sp.]
MPNYFAYSPEQAELLPRHVRDELPQGHLCFLIHELVESLDLRGFDEAYGEEGQKAYNPRLMLKVWLYGFAVNVRSSRKLERRMQEDLGFRFLAGGLRPDHKTLSQFVRRHGEAMEELFTQVLGWARRAGLVRLGRVAIDSTRIKANASPDRLAKQERQQVRRWRREMEQDDPDQEPGVEVSVDTAERLRREMKQSRVAAGEEKRSLSDADARFLRERGGKFRLGYSGELAVSEDHFMVAARITQEATDNDSLLPMLAEVERQCRVRPQQVLADSGFYSGSNVEALEAAGIDGYVPDSVLARELNLGQRVAEPRPVRHRATRRMRRKLRSRAGRRTYGKRKAMIEPVIGVLKEQRGMRQFLRRGLAAVGCEWLLAAISYNLTRCHRLLA